MLIIKKIKHLQSCLRAFRRKGKQIGFVPTMGALHDGHLALIRQSRRQGCATICSIFVNPTQFNDPADYQKYPITLTRDIDLLEKTGCDLLFLPDKEEIYPGGVKPPRPVSYGLVTEVLEGECRPGHFDGMVQVVRRLLLITRPDDLFMGQKDYQQQLIVGELIREMNLATRLHRCATVREKDGLAMSSRNVRLSPAARKRALVLYETLRYCRRVLFRIGAEQATAGGLSRMGEQKGVKVEYLSIRDAQTLAPFTGRKREAVVLVAAVVDGVRLIDNMLIQPKEAKGKLKK